MAKGRNTKAMMMAALLGAIALPSLMKGFGQEGGGSDKSSDKPSDPDALDDTGTRNFGEIVTSLMGDQHPPGSQAEGKFPLPLARPKRGEDGGIADLETALFGGDPDTMNKGLAAPGVDAPKVASSLSSTPKVRPQQNSAQLAYRSPASNPPVDPSGAPISQDYVAPGSPVAAEMTASLIKQGVPQSIAQHVVAEALKVPAASSGAPSVEDTQRYNLGEQMGLGLPPSTVAESLFDPHVSARPYDPAGPDAQGAKNAMDQLRAAQARPVPGLEHGHEEFAHGNERTIGERIPSAAPGQAQTAGQAVPVIGDKPRLSPEMLQVLLSLKAKEDAMTDHFPWLKQDQQQIVPF